MEVVFKIGLTITRDALNDKRLRVCKRSKPLHYQSPLIAMDAVRCSRNKLCVERYRGRHRVFDKAISLRTEPETSEGPNVAFNVVLILNGQDSSSRNFAVLWNEKHTNTTDIQACFKRSGKYSSYAGSFSFVRGTIRLNGRRSGPRARPCLFRR